ncbi:hypothetical protein PIROE2DRAFT_8308, partial [Piromyces sp. E2]
MDTIEEQSNYYSDITKTVYIKRLENYVKGNEIFKNDANNLFKSVDINSELKDYLNKNDISLKELNNIVQEVKNYLLTLSFEYSLINKYNVKKSNYILQDNLTYIENYVNNKRKEMYNRTVKVLKNNNLREFKEHLRKNDIDIGDMQTDDYDLLVYAIENNMSSDIIHYIVRGYFSLNYYFFDIEEGIEVEKSPLSSAIAEDNFQLADILIENKADINFKIFYNDIIKNLTINKLLDDKNLKYILDKGFSLSYVNHETSLIYELVKASYPSYFIEIIFKHFIFDNTFILHLLHVYRNKKELTHQQLNDFVKKEKSKIIIKDKWYSTAVEYEAFDAIDIFIEYDIRKEDAILNLIKKKI